MKTEEGEKVFREIALLLTPCFLQIDLELYDPSADKEKWMAAKLKLARIEGHALAAVIKGC
jgi:hypothetical protein